MLKLDFNERADSIPDWLKDFSVDSSQLWKYPNRQAVEGLIADKFGASADEVFLSNGGDESIELLFKLCKLNQQSILLPTPAFSQYTHNLNIWGIDHTVVEGLENLAIDTNAIKQQLQANQWLIITRPNNPTGECIDHDVLTDLIVMAKKSDAFVFLDEAYVEFYLANNGKTEYALAHDNVVSLRTFSKAYGLAGARIGYLIGHKQLIQQFKKVAMPFNVNRLSLQVVKMALKNITEMQRYCAKIAENRDLIYAILRSSGVEVFDGKGNFLLFKVGQKLKPLLSRYMQKNGIHIKTQVNDLQDWVRITIPEDITTVMRVLQTVFDPQMLGFDMDGVLIDTSESYDACIVQTVEHFTQKTITEQQITALRESGGFNNDWDLSAGLIKQMGSEVALDQVIARFQNFYDGDDDNIGLKYNEKALIQSLAIATFFDGRYATAIVTGRPRAEALQGVEQLSINPDYVISADDVSRQKPSPEGIEWFKDNSQKSRMWFCGDTVDDMQAGNAAGCVCVGIGPKADHLYEAGADIVLENINQLIELL